MRGQIGMSAADTGPPGARAAPDWSQRITTDRHRSTASPCQQDRRRAFGQSYFGITIRLFLLCRNVSWCGGAAVGARARTSGIGCGFSRL